MRPEFGEIEVVRVMQLKERKRGCRDRQRALPGAIRAYVPSERIWGRWSGVKEGLVSLKRATLDARNERQDVRRKRE